MMWIGQFPINYLGFPIHYRRLTNAQWKHIEERLQKCLGTAKKENSVLSNMVLVRVHCPYVWFW
jgi:hypothetical protein